MTLKQKIKMRCAKYFPWQDLAHRQAFIPDLEMVRRKWERYMLWWLKSSGSGLRRNYVQVVVSPLLSWVALGKVT